MRDRKGWGIDKTGLTTSLLAAAILAAVGIGYKLLHGPVEDLFRGSPSAAERTVDAFYADARLAPWSSEPHSLEGSRHNLEKAVTEETFLQPGTVNTTGSLTFTPARAALEARRYVGEKISIKGGTVLSLREIRHTDLELNDDGGNPREVDLFVAQIVEGREGDSASIFCEFPRATVHFETPPLVRGRLIEAEGVPIMFGVAGGRGGVPAPAAYFVCNGVRRGRP